MIVGTHHWPAQERVIYGRPAADALDDEVRNAGATRVFFTTTRSISHGIFIAKLIERLGQRFVGKFDAITAHSPREAVIAGTEALRASKANLMVAIGGGSVIDATKVMLLALWRGIHDKEALSTLAGIGASASAWSADPQRLRMIAIPTTFSAAEFSPQAATINTERRIKQMYMHPLAVPKSVILDPAATLETPINLLLSTGIRAIDHAIEGWCSIKTTPIADASNREAMQLLAKSLFQIKHDPQNLEPRAMAQHGMWLTRIATMAEIPYGASHGIGYLLGGGRGIPHGITSCVTLPAVMTWNENTNGARQADISAMFGGSGRSAGSVLREFIIALNLPSRLREVGIEHAELPIVAANWDGGGPIATNPRRVHDKSDLLEILELAW